MVRPRFNDYTMPGGWEPVRAWSCVTKLTGILVDAYYDLGRYGYHNFGVVEEPLHFSPGSCGPQAPTLEPIERVPDDDTCKYNFPLHRLTTGSLYNVARLEIRRCGNRSLGLRILHLDERDDCLGSWDPLDTPSVSTLYNSQHGTLVALRFHLANGEDGPYVSDITTCVKAADLRNEASEGGSGEEPQRQSPAPPGQPGNVLQFNCGEPGKV